MSEPSGSGIGKNALPSKAIGNLATTTRGGSAKMKFVPTLPVRRKKEDPKPEPKAEPSGESARGRGRGRGLGRGQGRGNAPPRPLQEMVASGPFALGPAMAGKSGRRSVPRSNFTPIVPIVPGGSKSGLSAGLTSSTTASLKRESRNEDIKIQDEDAYSDPDDGVEIIDIDDVRRMDWMAPESLVKEKNADKKKKIKKEPDAGRGKGKVKAEPEELDINTPEVADQIDDANALDLSESEEEEELEDIINDFALQEEEMVDTDLNIRQEKLYFFQFPEPFPMFSAPAASQPRQVNDESMESPISPDKGKKAVTFAADVKPPGAGSNAPIPTEEKKEADTPIDGVIGQLEIHQSGTVRMRLEGGILLDVTAATQPSFLQHAIFVDSEKKQLCVLGEVNRRFNISPNIDALLEALEKADLEEVAKREAEKMDIDPVDVVTNPIVEKSNVKGKGKEKEKPAVKKKRTV